MKIAHQGRDVIRIDDGDYNTISKHDFGRVHLIKIDFCDPTNEKMNWLLDMFPKTNRFIVDDNIRFYNSFLRNTNKKYYISNRVGDRLITFYKKNNKVLLDTTKLTELERQFVFLVDLEDVLLNTEVMIVTGEKYEENVNIFNGWFGNLIIDDKTYKI
jgi:hypothetical protein